MAESYDVVVIGGGPGGYVAAIRAAQLGMKTACVEMRSTLGGTCLNVGCIPSKALLQSSERYVEAQHALAAHGVTVSKVGLDLATMLARKDKVVGENVRGIEYLFRKNKVAWIKGAGRIAGPNAVEVASGGGKSDTLAAKSIVIATGSDVARLPGVEIDEKRIVSSTGALVLDSVPKRLVVIGAGYIGLELGSVWGRLGAEVTVVEFLDRICPGMDAEVARHLQRTLQKQGLTFRLGTKVAGAKTSGKSVTLSLEPAQGGAGEEIAADTVLVAVGRRPYTDGLGLEAAGVVLDEKKRVRVDGQFRTSVPNIYAIGDVIAGPMLAHKAEEEGSAVAEIIAGQKPHIDYDAIPAVIYTQPEVASVGKTEEELKAAGAAYAVGKFPFTANGR
ncbi:MAG TPA: dihydrolipoyl dehydrogenase, partial [Stellaceae bacterium]|nr:dihydrolipoyl dehydrogenase [Stellaceae bacterium]